MIRIRRAIAAARIASDHSTLFRMLPACFPHASHMLPTCFPLVLAAGCLTLVHADDTPAMLQAQNIDGEWITVEPVPGAFTCNVCPVRPPPLCPPPLVLTSPARLLPLAPCSPLYTSPTSVPTPICPLLSHAASPILQVGDMLARWTNGLFASTPHRVLPPPEGSSRISVPFFFEP